MAALALIASALLVIPREAPRLRIDPLGFSRLWLPTESGRSKESVRQALRTHWPAMESFCQRSLEKRPQVRSWIRTRLLVAPDGTVRDWEAAGSGDLPPHFLEHLGRELKLLRFKPGAPAQATMSWNFQLGAPLWRPIAFPLRSEDLASSNPRRPPSSLLHPLRSRTPDALHAYRLFLREDSTLRGTVELSFDLAAGGEVTACRIARSSGRPDLDEEFRRRIRRWNFGPVEQGETTVTWSLRLEAEPEGDPGPLEPHRASE